MRSDPVYIFTIDFDALERAVYPEKHRGLTPKKRIKKFVKVGRKLLPIDTKPVSMNLRDRLKQRWGL